MWKLLARIKNFFSSSNSGNFPRPPAPSETKGIEDCIDRVVYHCLTREDWNLMFIRTCGLSVKYWQSVVKAICFAESNFDPYSRYFEKSMGYYSEGLMQLSYEDCKAYNFPLDKSKNEIFDIEKNIQLGMIILNRLIKNHGQFIFNDGNYWAVLKPENKRHKIFLEKFNEYMGVL